LQENAHPDKQVHNGVKTEQSPVRRDEEPFYDIVVAGNDTLAGKSAMNAISTFLESPQLKHLRVLRISQVEDGAEDSLSNHWNASLAGVDTDRKLIFTSGTWQNQGKW
jgi:hypothetical protein